MIRDDEVTAGIWSWHRHRRWSSMGCGQAKSGRVDSYGRSADPDEPSTRRDRRSRPNADAGSAGSVTPATSSVGRSAVNHRGQTVDVRNVVGGGVSCSGTCAVRASSSTSGLFLDDRTRCMSCDAQLSDSLHEWCMKRRTSWAWVRSHAVRSERKRLACEGNWRLQWGQREECVAVSWRTDSNSYFPTYEVKPYIHK